MAGVGTGDNSLVGKGIDDANRHPRKANRLTTIILSIFAGLSLFFGLLWIVATIIYRRPMCLLYAVACFLSGFGIIFFWIWPAKDNPLADNVPDEKSEYL